MLRRWLCSWQAHPLMDIIGLKFGRIPIPVESVDANYDGVWRAKVKREGV